MVDFPEPSALLEPVLHLPRPEVAMNQTLATPQVWADGKRHLWWLGILPLATPLLSGTLAITSGVQQLWWVGVLVIFGLIPLIDGLLGEDVSNPPESAVNHLESQRYYRWIVYTGVLFVISSVVITGWLAAGGMAALGTSAWAQSSVEMFGIVDVHINSARSGATRLSRPSADLANLDFGDFSHAGAPS